MRFRLFELPLLLNELAVLQLSRLVQIVGPLRLFDFNAGLLDLVT